MDIKLVGMSQCGHTPGVISGLNFKNFLLKNSQIGFTITQTMTNLFLSIGKNQILTQAGCTAHIQRATTEDNT